MRPTLSRQVLSVLGLMVGFALYALAGRLTPPWDRMLIGGVFMALGISTYVYARGERWIQVVGAVLVVYGVVRAVLLR